MFFFLHKYKLCIVWAWLITKIILISQKRFEAIQNGGTECSRLEERSVIKILEDEKYRPYEIYRRMHDAYKEAGVSKKKKNNNNNK